MLLTSFMASLRGQHSRLERHLCAACQFRQLRHPDRWPLRRGEADRITNGGDEEMNWTDRRRRFRAILKGNRCYHPASVFDPLSARIAQQLGFEVDMVAGSTASLTVLGAPDLILITL